MCKNQWCFLWSCKQNRERELNWYTSSEKQLAIQDQIIMSYFLDHLKQNDAVANFAQLSARSQLGRSSTAQTELDLLFLFVRECAQKQMSLVRGFHLPKCVAGHSGKRQLLCRHNLNLCHRLLILSSFILSATLCPLSITLTWQFMCHAQSALLCYDFLWYKGPGAWYLRNFCIAVWIALMRTEIALIIATWFCSHVMLFIGLVRAFDADVRP